MKLKTLLLALTALGLAQGARASVIAIIDSGTALDHQDLRNKKWINPKDIDDAVDNDNNGLIDDVNGWNFAEGNNKLYDKSLLGTFSPDSYRFFEIQTRIMQGVASTEEVDWLKQKVRDQKFIAELSVFGNFIHGTHVAGIAANGADEAKIMPIKLIPTKAPTVGGGNAEGAFEQTREGGISDWIIRKGLSFLAKQQGRQLAPIGKYVGSQKARLANCSFGTSTRAAKGFLKPLLSKVLRRDPTDTELDTYAIFFVGEVVKAAEAFVSPAPNTLFVIAAGNDGMDNDRYPTSPANIKRDNTITVAATNGYQRLASFSNFGASMVEVAAPGVAILSAIPGNAHLTVNGTSQAAPFVTSVAGRMLDANPSLSNADVKGILMATSDPKDFLKGRVVSGGVVNPDRAILAAKLSLSMQVKDAIEFSRSRVNDVREVRFEKESSFDGYALPLPSLFF